MRVFVVVTLLIFLGRVWSEEEPDDRDVIVLDESNFAEGVNVDLILVEFYAPWCGHCKRLAPEYAKAATALKDVDPPVPLAKVDCPANSALCSKYGVSGYPTLKIFRDGEISSDYNGPRTTNGIVDIMKKQSGPSSRELKTIDDVKQFIDHDEHSVVGFFSSEDSSLKSSFLTVSNSLRESFQFGHTFSKDVLDEYGYNDDVAIFQPPFMISKLEDSPFVYDGPVQMERLKHFIKAKFMGLAGVRDFDTQKFFEEKQPLCVVYFDVDYSMNPKGTNYWRNRVLKVAKDFDGKVSFAVSDGQDFHQEVEALGLTDDGKTPSAGIYDHRGKYAMEETFSVDNLRQFVNTYLDGGLEPYMKSEPIPEPNDGPVKVVVGRNFEQIVNDESKDVLLEFYAPWCGHCKALAPKFEELGEKLQDDPNIVIAKSDATANDYPPGYDVRGYPTIFWVPAGSKSKPIKYEGGREVSDFISYLKKNATNKPVVVKGEKEKKKEKKQEL